MFFFDKDSQFSDVTGIKDGSKICEQNILANHAKWHGMELLIETNM